MLDRSDPTLLTAAQAAARLGISPTTLYDTVRAGQWPKEIPILKRGRRMAFSSRSLDRYVAGEVQVAS